MGTAFAGIVRTPLTSVIMIFELTRDYSIIVPLMISNLISFIISVKLQPEPIYEALALQEGVYLPTGESREDLEGVRVDSIMCDGPDPLPPDMPVKVARSRLAEMQRTSWPVAEGNQVIGLITARRLDDISNPETPLREALAEEVYAYVYPDHPASYAMERMGSAGADSLPVVSRANRAELKGIVTLSGVLTAFGVYDRKEGSPKGPKT